jgi:ribonucleotide reductase alpha subunit
MTQDLTDEEKARIDKKFTKWLKKIKKKGGQYTLFKPQSDMTLEEIYAATGAYNYDVSIVDYVTLLADMDGDDQWRKIGAAGRFAKIDAENRKRVNILLAQLNDEGKIRYSRALTEHSNLSWIWLADDESKETGYTRIEQAKSRNSRAFPFYVKMIYNLMRVENVDQEQFGGASLGKVEEEEGSKKRKKDKAKKRPKVENLGGDV